MSKTKLSQQAKDIISRMQIAKKMIPVFRNDIHRRIANSIDLTKSGCITPECTVQTYESIAATYGEDYATRNLREEEELEIARG